VIKWPLKWKESDSIFIYHKTKLHLTTATCYLILGGKSEYVLSNWLCDPHLLVTQHYLNNLFMYMFHLQPQTNTCEVRERTDLQCERCKQHQRCRCDCLPPQPPHLRTSYRVCHHTKYNIQLHHLPMKRLRQTSKCVEAAQLIVTDQTRSGLSYQTPVAG